MWLNKCPKTPFSEDHSKSNVVNGSKNFWNMNDSTFRMFNDPCEDNSIGKSFSQWYAKSWDCLLIHWLLITSILFLIDAIYCNIFRWLYLRNEKYVLILFFFAFSKFKFNFEHLQKKDDPHPWCIFELTGSERRDYINALQVPFQRNLP